MRLVLHLLNNSKRTASILKRICRLFRDVIACRSSLSTDHGAVEKRLSYERSPFRSFFNARVGGHYACMSYDSVGNEAMKAQRNGLYVAAGTCSGHQG